jgi:hypothetical protein
MLLMLAGTVVLLGGLDPGANAGIDLIPTALIELGIGALASQLCAITVSAVPDDRSAEVGGLENTFTNFGASLGTALVGAVLVGSLSTTFFQGITDNPTVPASVTAQATEQVDSGVPFISDADLRTESAKTDLPASEQDAIVSENAKAWLIGLFFTDMPPRRSLVAGPIPAPTPSATT